MIFGSGDTRFLISLLNAIFESKMFNRKVKSLVIVNPNLEKHSRGDKLSMLDIRAQLEDGTTILIEMHLYDLFDLKYKTIRSWARAYGEELSSGERYSVQTPVICVTFANGQVVESEKQKIHSCCKIMDIDDNTVLSDALELHYIDMKAYVDTINETGSIGNGETHEAMLVKWLAVITEKDLIDKTIIKNICVEQEEIGMAVSALARLSKDKITRQEYLKRQDEIVLYYSRIGEYKRRIEQFQHRVDQEQHRADQQQSRADQQQYRADAAEAEVKKLLEKIAQLEAQSKT